MAEPVMPEKIRDRATFTCAVPPFILPNRPLQKLNILSVISDSFSTFAMNTNSGAASMVKPAIMLPVKYVRCHPGGKLGQLRENEK